MDLIEEIEGFIREADILSHMLANTNFMIDKMEGDPSLQDHYKQELPPILDEYRQTIQALMFLFDQYFDWEKQNNAVSNLRYRRIYKKLSLEIRTTPPTSCPA